jgi:excinuclease UvrABC nuclease subunit
VCITRDLQDPVLKGAKVFGPFTAVGALREAVTLAQRVFKFRTCSLDIVDGDPKNAFFRPCILHAINQCTAPCAGKIGKEAYFIDADRFIRFIQGKRSVMIREMTEQMLAASASLEFEKAAVLRDQLQALERLDQRAKGSSAGKNSGWQPETEMSAIDPKKALLSLQKTLGLTLPIRCIEAIDIAHLQGNETVGSKVCFLDGRPFKNEYRRYRIKAEGSRDQGIVGSKERRDQRIKGPRDQGSNSIPGSHDPLIPTPSSRIDDSGVGKALGADEAGVAVAAGSGAAEGVDRTSRGEPDPSATDAALVVLYACVEAYLRRRTAA